MQTPAPLQSDDKYISCIITLFCDAAVDVNTLQMVRVSIHSIFFITL